MIYISNSFCVLSSAFQTLSILNDKTKYNYCLDITYPIYYPMLCREKYLTVSININI